MRLGKRLSSAGGRALRAKGDAYDFKPASPPLLCSQKSLLESEKPKPLHGRGFAGIPSEFNFVRGYAMPQPFMSEERGGMKEGEEEDDSFTLLANF